MFTDNLFAENKRIDEFQARAPEEEVLEPELPIVDAHHHLWDIRKHPMDALSQFEQKVYLCEDIMHDIRRSGHNIVKTVFAECGAFYRADGPVDTRCVGETEFAHGIAAMSRSGYYGDTRLCSGIFGAADLSAGPAVEAVIQAHRDASTLFRGVRIYGLDDSYHEALKVLAKYQLSCDYWSHDYMQLPALAAFANAHPDVTFIVDHLGGKVDADASDADFNAWRQCIEAVGSCSNVVLKLGGTQMRNGEWEPVFHMHRATQPPTSKALCEMLYPYYLAGIETFGAERCMFESNFPVDREGVSYRSVWNLFKRIATKAGASDSEKQQLFSGTASRVYRL